MDPERSPLSRTSGFQGTAAGQCLPAPTEAGGGRAGTENPSTPSKRACGGNSAGRGPPSWQAYQCTGQRGRAGPEQDSRPWGSPRCWSQDARDAAGGWPAPQALRGCVPCGSGHKATSGLGCVLTGSKTPGPVDRCRRPPLPDLGAPCTRTRASLAIGRDLEIRGSRATSSFMRSEDSRGSRLSLRMEYPGDCFR